MASLIFVSITVFFFALLIVKGFMKREFCAICASVSATWLIFLVLYQLGYINEPILIGILMGGSAVGFFYFIERRTKEELHFFRLPFLLTLMFAAYAFLVWDPSYQILGFIAGLWVLFGGVYLFRKKPTLSKMVKKIIECCKNW